MKITTQNSSHLISAILQERWAWRCSSGGAVPQEVVLVGETLQQQAEDVADGGDSGLGERGVPQGQQQPGDQLELPQQFGVLRRLAVSQAKEHTWIRSLQRLKVRI